MYFCDSNEEGNRRLCFLIVCSVRLCFTLCEINYTADMRNRE